MSSIPQIEKSEIVLNASQAGDNRAASVKKVADTATNLLAFLSQEGPYIAIYMWVFVNLRALRFESKQAKDDWGNTATITTIAGPAGIIINPILAILGALGKLADPAKAIQDAIGQAVRGVTANPIPLAYLTLQVPGGQLLVDALSVLDALKKLQAANKFIGDGPGLEAKIIGWQKDYEQINECIRIKVRSGVPYDIARKDCENIFKPIFGPNGPIVFRLGMLDCITLAAIVVLMVRAIVSFVGFGRKGVM